MQRINVIGTSGSGKSTFSTRLAEILGYRYIQMDALYWKPNWQESSNDEFFATLKRALADDCWVLDGNYNKTNHIKWRRTDTLIWLDYSFPRTFCQMLGRSVKRASSKQEIWPGTGNAESFRRSFFSSDSVLWWMLKSYRRNKIEYRRLFEQRSEFGVQLIRLRSPRQADEFLHALQQGMANRPHNARTQNGELYVE